MLSLI